MSVVMITEFKMVDTTRQSEAHLFVNCNGHLVQWCQNGWVFYYQIVSTILKPVSFTMDTSALTYYYILTKYCSQFNNFALWSCEVLWKFLKSLVFYHIFLWRCSDLVLIFGNCWSYNISAINLYWKAILI